MPFKGGWDTKGQVEPLVYLLRGVGVVRGGVACPYHKVRLELHLDCIQSRLEHLEPGVALVFSYHACVRLDREAGVAACQVK